MRIVFCCILMSLSYYASGQVKTNKKTHVADTIYDAYDERSHILAGINYLTDNVYLGRKDSIVTPYLSSYVGYQHKSGVYAKANLAYSRIKHNVDLFTIEAGYERSLTDRLTAGLSAEKYFYNKNSNNIRGNIKGSAGLYLKHENKWFSPQLSFDANFGKKTDYIVGLFVDRPFRIGKSRWQITPSAGTNGATQHFYNEYFVNNVARKDKTSTLSQAIKNAGKFKIMDYEIGLKTTCVLNKWLLSGRLTYYIPVNPVIIDLPNNNIKELIANTMVMELDICYR